DADDGTLTWSSSDESVAIVDSDGYVKALTEGTTIIKASTTNGVYAECTVTVSAIPVSEVKFYPSDDKWDITAGYTHKIEIFYIYPSDATDKSLTWS
ncbi:MAG: Ig-like domain-containing protein, partial [Eubacteriales bacterium]|nr:Ig-like domain-containing protein [Eubacteriales bacterium]